MFGLYNALPLPIGPAPASPRFDPPRLLCLGRTVREKGFDVAVAALPLIRHAFPDARLTIAGDGPDRRDLIAQAAELGLSDAIDFAGFVPPDEVADLIERSSLLLVPSRWHEPFGLVALEAAHMARPVVATRRGGLPEVVRDGETGLIVEPESPAALAGAVIGLIEAPESACAMGAAGRRLAETAFPFDRFVDEHVALYSRLAARSGSLTR